MKVKVKLPPRSHHKAKKSLDDEVDYAKHEPEPEDEVEEVEVEVPAESVPPPNDDLREALQRLVSLAGSAGPSQPLRDAFEYARRVLGKARKH